jgi:hypothetical protein
MSDKAYVPLNQGKFEQAPKQIDEPQYPDQGVAFAGYSKKLLSGNDYKLYPQTRFSIVDESTSITNTTIQNTVHGDVTRDPTKKIYITSMQIAVSISAIVNDSYASLYDYGVSGKLLWKTGLLRSGNIEVVFPVPLEISTPYQLGVSPNGLVLQYSTGTGATINKLVWSLQGWSE